MNTNNLDTRVAERINNLQSRLINSVVCDDGSVIVNVAPNNMIEVARLLVENNLDIDTHDRVQEGMVMLHDGVNCEEVGLVR